MITRTFLIMFLGVLGIIPILELEASDYLTPNILTGSILVLTLILIIDLWKTKWQEPDMPKIDAHTESLSFTAHQLRSPLTVIKGYADLITDGTYGEVSNDIKDVGLKIKAAADRAFNTINQILDFNSLISGRATSKPEKILLNEFVSERLKTHELAVKDKGLQLNFSPSPTEINVFADSSQFEHIINNIVDNAIKYTDKGKIEVRTAIDSSSKFALLEIADTGKGIPVEIIETIFMPFERDPRYAYDVKGMGLGLSIAKKLSELNNFKIWAKSDGVGRGAVFYLRMPLNAKK